MALRLPNGSNLSIASAYAAAQAVTALTNADPAVASIAAHGIADGSILQITSGWPSLNDRVVRSDNANAGDLEYEGVDTSDTAKYPAGSGTGSVVEVIAWTQITQILESSFEGGDQQFYTYSYLEDDIERRIPTVKSAQGLSLTLADDIALPWYDVLKAADESRSAQAIRLQLPGGSVLYYNAYVTMNESPTLTKNEGMSLKATLSFLNTPTRYAS